MLSVDEHLPVSSRNPDFFQVMGGNNPRKRGDVVLFPTHG